MTQKMDQEILLQKLNAIADAWKAQQPGKCTSGFHLEWTIEENILFLNGVWICPVKFILLEKLDDCIQSIGDVSIPIALRDSDLDIIIISEFGEYEISVIERYICR